MSSYLGTVWRLVDRPLGMSPPSSARLRRAVSGKRVVVTGASSGIGRALAIRLGEAGATLILVARTRSALEEVAAEVAERGGSASVHPADLSDGDDAGRVAEEILREHEGVDILVNNAGHSIRRSIAFSYERVRDFERTIELNYLGAVRLTLAFLRGMRERGFGHVVNVSTLGVHFNLPRYSAYLASKNALDAFARSIAPEVIADGVHVTTVYMPLVRTPMIRPTRLYRVFPALSPSQAAGLVLRAIVDRPREVGARVALLGLARYLVGPKLADRLVNAVAGLVPDSPAARALGEGEDDDEEEGAERPPRAEPGGAPKSRPKRAPRARA